MTFFVFCQEWVAGKSLPLTSGDGEAKKKHLGEG